jgi:N4-gp56 family major capsid protein
MSYTANQISTNTEWQRVYYDRVLLERLLPNLIWTMFGQPKPMPQNEGQSVNFHGYESLAVATTELTEGVTPAGSLLSMINFSATPKQYGDFVEITDKLDMTAPDPVLTNAAELLGEQAAETIDTLVRDILALATNVQYAGTANTQAVEVAATDILDEIEIKKAVRTMHTNKIKKLTQIVNASTGVGTVPVAPAFVGIVSAATLYDLKGLTDKGWTPVEEYASTGALLPYEVGKLDEVRFVMTHNPIIETGAGSDSPANDIHHTLIFGRDAYGIIQLAGVQNIIKGFGAGNDPLNQRATSGWKCFFTTKILQQLAILRVVHGVTA